MSTKETIEANLASDLEPAFLEVFDVSHTHSGPPDAESHFKVVVVCERFEGKPLIARHRAVNKSVDMEKNHIHALEIHGFAPSEWTKAVAAEVLPITGGCR